MTKRISKPTFSVAMSRQDGCLVMVRTNGKSVTVIGSLDQEQSIGIAQSILEFTGGVAMPEALKRSAIAYPH